MFAAINHVAGKASQRKMGASQEEQYAPGNGENDPENNEQFSEIRHSSVRFTSC